MHAMLRRAAGGLARTVALHDRSSGIRFIQDPQTYSVPLFQTPRPNPRRASTPIRRERDGTAARDAAGKVAKL